MAELSLYPPYTDSPCDYLRATPFVQIAVRVMDPTYVAFSGRISATSVQLSDADALGCICNVLVLSRIVVGVSSVIVAVWLRHVVVWRGRSA
jgi:hypothetical protein